ncbi:MAG TPA: hypothetical protein VG328_03200 [Stellaceae bacterium]|nr:hypothetical protein [Stellaceae bacterium]
MKASWLSIGAAVLCGGAITLLALLVIAHSYGNHPTMSDIELALGCGGALGAALVLI